MSECVVAGILQNSGGDLVVVLATSIPDCKVLVFEDEDDAIRWMNGPDCELFSQVLTLDTKNGSVGDGLWLDEICVEEYDPARHGHLRRPFLAGGRYLLAEPITRPSIDHHSQHVRQ